MATKELPYVITTRRGKSRTRSRKQDKKFHTRKIDHTHVHPNGRRVRYTYNRGVQKRTTTGPRRQRSRRRR